MNTFEELQTLVIKWSRDRKIIPNATPISQLLKTVAEVGELADAVNKRNRLETVDAVGDVLVCLINFCELEYIDPVECLQHAYEQIKDRKGTLLPSGVFVKDEQS